MMPSSIGRISIVIPCLNDAEALSRCLSRLGVAGSILSCELEVIVADASEDEACREIAREHADTIVVHVKKRGRGQQLNAGAHEASGQLLLFNHADTELTAEHMEAVVRVAQTSNMIGGAFYRDLAWQYPRLAWFEPLARWYVRKFGILYGDQSIFVSRQTFDSMGGFADVPIMEDVDFSSRLRKQGPIALIDPPLRTSMRRFKRRGYLLNKIQNVLIIWLWRLNLISPEQIYRWYYRASMVS